MTFFRSLVAIGLVASVVAAPPVPAAAQGRGGDYFALPPGLGQITIDADTIVKGAPYSADAITTMTQVLEDGTRIERSVTAKVYRDGMGRTRREQTVLGLASFAPAADGQRVITIVDPVEGVTITLDENARTARRAVTPRLRLRLDADGSPVYARRAPLEAAGLNLRLAVADGAARQSLPVDDRLKAVLDLLNRAASETQRRGGGGGGRGAAAAADRGTTTPLGTRQLEGLTVTGRRTTQTIPAGQIGNDRPIAITDEVWESPALQVVVSLRHTDPRTGTLEYHLSSVVLGEPPADLFTIPPGYTVLGAPARPTVAPGTAAPGARGGGGGGRGGRSGGQP